MNTLEAATDSAKQAQQERAKKYHIAVKDGGAITRPAEWADIPDDLFADPVNYRYPMKDKTHSDNATARWGDMSNRSQYSDAEQKIIAERIAARQRYFGEKPDEKKETQEAAARIANSLARPRKKIATLRVCWLEYSAYSVNKRIYPKATCDTIYESGLKKLAADDLPITVFVSHEAANGNVNTELVGRVVRLWQEGTKFWADLDLADTRTAWDMLALAEGGYLRSESMRVLGVELSYDRNYDLPLVVVSEGVEPELLGIDLTTRPGLMDTARIQQVLYEQASTHIYTESFVLDAVCVHEKADKEDSVAIPIYLKLISGAVLAEGLTADRQAHQRIHDHLAGVMDDAVAPMHGSESARFVTGAALTEEGRAIAKKHAAKLAMAHDESARQLGMECEGCYRGTLGIPLDPDQDGDVDAELVIPDDDDGEESARMRQKKGKAMTMTEAQMLAALQAKGYAVTAPKTIEEEMAELRAQVAQLTAATPVAAPARQTQAPSAMTETSSYQPEPMYETGDYLAGPIHPKHWQALSNRAVPWPKDVDPWQAVNELAPFLAYGITSQQAAMMNRDTSAFIAPDEQV